MTSTLRYAAHLGFRSPDQPLFPESAGSSDPIAQIEFAASIGFAGVQDPWFGTRPKATQAAIAERLRELDLSAGCVVCGSPSDIRTPLWTRSGAPAEAALEKALTDAFEAAHRLRAREVAVVTGADPEAPRNAQLDRFAANLARASKRAEAEGLLLCLETMNARTLPGMFLNRFDEACAVVRAVGSRMTRMIFDTAHIQSMDGDLIGRLERNFDLIAIVQIANHPGRTEPETGEINMAAVLKRVHALGYRGLIELEHVWSRPGLDAERRGLAWLKRTDASLAPTKGEAGA